MFEIANSYQIIITHIQMVEIKLKFPKSFCNLLLPLK